MDTVTYLTIQWGMLLAITSRMPEAKLLILRVRDRPKGITMIPPIFAQTFKSSVLTQLAVDQFYPTVFGRHLYEPFISIFSGGSILSIRSIMLAGPLSETV
jgi:hypothetical protein